MVRCGERRETVQSWPTPARAVARTQLGLKCAKTGHWFHCKNQTFAVATITLFLDPGALLCPEPALRLPEGLRGDFGTVLRKIPPELHRLTDWS